jgi:hypothetical protein
MKKRDLGIDQAKSPLKSPIVWGAVAGAALYKAIRNPNIRQNIKGITKKG